MPATTPPSIPPWVPPVTPAPILNGQRLNGESRFSVGGNDAVIPILRGPWQIRVTDQYFFVLYDESTGTWTVGIQWGWGEIQAIDIFKGNGEDPVAGVLVNHYTGTTTQGVDPLLAAAVPGYAEDLVITTEHGTRGIAYTVVQWTDDQYETPPEWVGGGRGLKVYDPDDVAQDEGDPSTWLYSVCPAHHWRDHVTQAFWGGGYPVDDASVINTADDNNAIVVTEARRELGLVIDTRQSWDSWRQTLETYAGAWGIKRGDTWRLISDRPRATDFTIDETDMVPDSFVPVVAPLESIPTHIRLYYTDTSETIWRDASVEVELAGVATGDVDRRTSEVRMPGIQRSTQAKREANERLKKLQAWLQAETMLYDDYIGVEVGDVGDISHPKGFANVLMRVIPDPEIPRIGRPRIRLSRYSADDYDDSEDDTVFPSTIRYGGTLIGKRAQLARNIYDENGILIGDDDALNENGPQVNNLYVDGTFGLAYRDGLTSWFKSADDLTGVAVLKDGTDGLCLQYDFATIVEPTIIDIYSKKPLTASANGDFGWQFEVRRTGTGSVGQLIFMAELFDEDGASLGTIDLNTYSLFALTDTNWNFHYELVDFSIMSAFSRSRVTRIAPGFRMYDYSGRTDAIRIRSPAFYPKQEP